MWRAESQVDKILFRSALTFQNLMARWDTLEIVPNANPDKFRIIRSSDGTSPRLLKRKSDWHEYNMQMRAYSKSNHFLEPIFIPDTTASEKESSSSSVSIDDESEPGILSQDYLEDAVYLADYMKANENDVVALRSILKQLETAIEILNEQNIQHGDMDAAGNILVHADHIIIIDFDMANATTQPVNRVFDYPAFLSEQLRGEFEHILFRKPNARKAPPPPQREQNRAVRQKTDSGLRLRFDSDPFEESFDV